MLLRKIQPSLGFTLIEVALVLLVLTLLLGGLLVPLGTQLDQRNTTSTEKQLMEIKEALIGYALQNGYLPCPDTDGDGQENVNGPPAGTCTADSPEPIPGTLPWANLGVGAEDAWGTRFIYRVTPLFSNHSFPFQLQNTGNINVCTVNTSAASCTTGTSLANDAVLVVASLGKNRGMCGSPPSAGNCGSDEQENLDSDNRFIMRTLSGQGSGSGEFDDILVWLSSNILVKSMADAGRWSGE